VEADPWPGRDKPITIDPHALERMTRRGASEAEVIAAIQSGTRQSAKRDRLRAVKRFPVSTPRGPYTAKDVVPIFVEEADRIVVVTVYVYWSTQWEGSA
jgi:hypothetical protein